MGLAGLVIDKIRSVWYLQSEVTGLNITAAQHIMFGLIGALTGQIFVLPVMLTRQVG